MPDIPTKEPEIMFSGETVQWKRSLSDYPATDYTLKYYLNGPVDYSLSGTAYNTTDHLITLAAATSATWEFGRYRWNAFAEKGSGASLEKYFIDSGTIDVLTAHDKSFAQTMLDAIEAILEGRATWKDLDIIAKSPGMGGSMTRDPEKLIQWRNQFTQECLSEQAEQNRKRGKATGNRILMQFKRPN